MKPVFIVLLLFAFSFAAFGQKKPVTRSPIAVDLPESYSSVYDIRQFERYAIVIFGVADRQKSADAIRKVLEKEPSIKFTVKRNEVQFFIFYQETIKGSQMRVKYFTEDKNVTVWAEDRKEKGKETELTEEFLKVLQRNQKLDVPDEPGDAK